MQSTIQYDSDFLAMALVQDVVHQSSLASTQISCCQELVCVKDKRLREGGESILMTTRGA